MAIIAITPLVLKDCTVTIGPHGFEKHLSSVTFTPKSSQIEWQGLEPTSKFTDTTSATWSVALEYAQDWETANSLSKYLFAEEGTSVVMVFKPKKAGSPTFTATVSITPGAIGGKVNSFATTTVTLGSNKPVLT